MGMLTDKLNVLHVGMDQDRNTRFEYIQGKLQQLDDKLGVSQDQTGRKFVIIKDHVVKFQDELWKEKQIREEVTASKEAEIARVENVLTEKLLSEQDERKAAEQRILNHFNSKTQAVKDQIDQSAVERNLNQAKLQNYLEVEIPKLYESLKQEGESREAMETRMLATAMEEVAHLQGAVLAERRAREDSEEAMLRMMEDFVAKIQSDIEAERAERARMEKELLRLLHDTCARMQTANQSL